MTQQETFEWLRERSNRLDQAEAEIARLKEEREPCSGAMLVARDLQGMTGYSSLPTHGVCGICEQRVPVDGFQRCVVHPVRGFLQGREKDALEAQVVAVTRERDEAVRKAKWAEHTRQTFENQLNDKLERLVETEGLLRNQGELEAQVVGLVAALRMSADRRHRAECDMRRAFDNPETTHQTTACQEAIEALAAGDSLASTVLARVCAPLEAQIAALRDALIWCSGSADFAPGGVARVGWEKVAPLLTQTAEAADAVLSRERQAAREEALEEAARYIESYASVVEPVSEDEAKYVHPRLASAIRRLATQPGHPRKE